MKSLQYSLIALALALPGTAFGADPGTLIADCDGCHGPDGVSTDGDIPSIAGQPADYIAGALHSFQRFGRPCKTSAYRHGDTSRPATKMCKVAADLNDEDINGLAEHYAALPFTAARQDFDPDKAAAGELLHKDHCESCHHEGGSVPARGPILAGQWATYLNQAIEEALSAEHLVPPLMENELMSFDKKGIDALVNFYASQQESSQQESSQPE